MQICCNVSSTWEDSMFTWFFIPLFISFLIQFVYKFLIESYRSVVPQLSGFVGQPFVSVRMIETAHGLNDCNVVFVRIYLRHATDLARQQQIQVLVGYIQIHRLVFWALLVIKSLFSIYFLRNYPFSAVCC